MLSCELCRQKFCRRVFLAAGIYGLAVLLPQYFLANRVGRDFPPINHLEYFYGFIGVAVAWQFVFLLIASDARKFRVMMLPAILEKTSFGVPAIVLHFQGRAPQVLLIAGLIDLGLGVLFLLAFLMS